METLAFSSLDLKKAFDTVKHSAIYLSLRNAGVDANFCEYVEFVYSNARTRLQFRGNTSAPILPTKGVRQGDPMSPVLFFLFFDNILRAIPDYEGFETNECPKLNKIAYADDLIVLSNSTNGLRNIFDRMVPVMKNTGLEINMDKSFTCHWKKDGKNKRVLFDRRPFISIRNREMRAMEASEQFKYLGVMFRTTGRLSIKTELTEILHKSPLKPQEKLFFLVKFTIPGVLHQLTFSKLYAGTLNKLDILIRSTVRAILHLPHDVPWACFHASPKDGGLGIPPLRWAVPVLAKNRGMYYPKLLTYEGIELKSTGQVHTRMRWKLLEAIDGAGLRETGQVPAASSWILDGTTLMTGRNYISSAQLRLNTLYSRSRAAKGRSTNHQCSRGCPQPETLNHMLQLGRRARHPTMATAGFTCELCSKWFRTKIGLGVHSQFQHRAEYEAAIQVPKSKTRWSSEELAIMAMNEALLIAQGWLIGV
ncbi:Retrovirus-related Pol polyprotein from type-2 retrotransposable element R2DM [Araneus ventricosus]|uniref:Retrovirus-related Pol polyprotein from type-2 retrotransposable element R2DM n=1 Tax=Araneus ventricosus TaxID=182803 RepID=A0A4Y2QWM5_ARAVE|nr:Retrovirus-related Pol polyprotein from type-2 retrotransposable element R2DM [Araneus ventricosus]